MLTATTPKQCLACDKPVKGRADKKFCDDYCRNAYNNMLKAGSSKLVTNINNVLKKNRRILEDLLTAGDETSRASKEKLLSKGFSFKYITHTYTNKKGNTYLFCYEYGYLPLEHDWYLIVKGKDD